MIIDKIKALGYNYSDAPVKILNAIVLLEEITHKSGEAQAEKVKILDQKIFESLLRVSPDDQILLKIKEEVTRTENEIVNEGFNTTANSNQDENSKAFINAVIEHLEAFTKLNKVSLQRIGTQHKITDVTKVYEYAEYAWVKFYRKIALLNEGLEKTYKFLTDFYLNIQPVYSLRDSVKIEFQQYSTPVPIAYLAQEFCKVREAELIFEPSAGNGLLVFEAPYENTIVNELDIDRYKNLTRDPYKKILKQDAELRFFELQGKVDALLSNPPFGRLAMKAQIDGYQIKALDHAMVAVALETLKDNGKAGIIIGGHTRYNEDGVVTNFRVFFNWLFHYYNISDIININGDLYYKQGTTFDIRLILINSRKRVPDGFCPIIRDIYHPLRQVVNNYESLFERVSQSINNPHWLFAKDKAIKVIEAQIPVPSPLPSEAPTDHVKLLFIINQIKIAIHYENLL